MAKFGEPSVRRLNDGTWVMAYCDHGTQKMVTRKASRPDRVRTIPETQFFNFFVDNYYGGFIHP